AAIRKPPIVPELHAVPYQRTRRASCLSPRENRTSWPRPSPPHKVSAVPMTVGARGSLDRVPLRCGGAAAGTKVAPEARSSDEDRDDLGRDRAALPRPEEVMQRWIMATGFAWTLVLTACGGSGGDDGESGSGAMSGGTGAKTPPPPAAPQR